MDIDEKSISLVKNILCFPKKYGLPLLPLWKCFNITNIVTPQDKLYEQYISYVNVPWPKMYFYLILRMMYKHYSGIDNKSGHFGYRLSFVDPQKELREVYSQWLNTIDTKINEIIGPREPFPIQEFLLERYPEMIFADPVLASNRHSRRAEAAQKRKNK